MTSEVLLLGCYVHTCTCSMTSYYTMHKECIGIAYHHAQKNALGSKLSQIDHYGFNF